MLDFKLGIELPWIKEFGVLRIDRQEGWTTSESVRDLRVAKKSRENEGIATIWRRKFEVDHPSGYRQDESKEKAKGENF